MRGISSAAPGVTGFVGTGTDPTPVSDAEIAKIKKRMGVEEPKHHIDFSVGEVVNITDGPFKRLRRRYQRDRLAKN